MKKLKFKLSKFIKIFLKVWLIIKTYKMYLDIMSFILINPIFSWSVLIEPLINYACEDVVNEDNIKPKEEASSSWRKYVTPLLIFSICFIILGVIINKGGYIINKDSIINNTNVDVDVNTLMDKLEPFEPCAYTYTKYHNNYFFYTDTEKIEKITETEKANILIYKDSNNVLHHATHDMFNSDLFKNLDVEAQKEYIKAFHNITFENRNNIFKLDVNKHIYVSQRLYKEDEQN